MTSSVPSAAVGIDALDCITPLGNSVETHRRLLSGDIALKAEPVLGENGGDTVPLALLAPMNGTVPPRWWDALRAFGMQIPEAPWGTSRFPIFVTSSNFGVDNLLAYCEDRRAERLDYSIAYKIVGKIRQLFGWGRNVTIFSHACVSAHLGLLQAARALQAGMAERALVFSFDFVSGFVAGGFHSLKILNDQFPQPYADRPVGSIGLGDGAAFAVLSNKRRPLRIGAQTTYNEMHHFTGNEPSGVGFDAMAAPLREAARGRRLWIKGHGTGTLESGRLECQAAASNFPDAPLVSWKGSLGHTLGSCGLVELAIAAQAIRDGKVPGTVATTGPCFAENVALKNFDAAPYEAVLLASNAFGGAHAGLLLEHD